MKRLSRNQEINIHLSLTTILLTLFGLILAGATLYFSFFHVTQGFVGVVNNVDRHLEYIDVNISLSNPGNRTRTIARTQLIGWFGVQQGKPNQSNVAEWSYWIINPQSISQNLPITLIPDQNQVISIRVPFSIPLFPQLEQGITPSEYTLASSQMSEAHPEMFFPFFSGSCESDYKLFYLAIDILSLDANGTSTYSRLPLSALCIHLDPNFTANSGNYEVKYYMPDINSHIDLLSNPYRVIFFP